MNPIQYADNTENWEKWWYGYQYGAFYIFPAEEVMQIVDALRQKYDPKSAGYCRAHISLSEPLTHPITEAEIRSLEQDLQSVKSFEIEYGPIQTHPPYPGVTFKINPEETFAQLRKIIHANKLFDGVEIKRSTIVPHMTIAEFVSMERTMEIFDELKDITKSGKFICDKIVLAVPDNDFYFNQVLEISLGE